MAAPARRKTRLRALLQRGVAASAIALGMSGCVPREPSDGSLRVERELGEPGGFPGQVSYPRAIDTDGRALWVVDKTARIQQIDPVSGRAGVWWRMPDYALGKPTGLTVAPAAGPDGTLAPALYVADTHCHRVMVYAIPETFPPGPTEIEPNLLAQFGSFGQEPGQFIYPTDVAVLLDREGSHVERIYVSEYGGNDRVCVFDAEHNFLFAFGSPGDGDDPNVLEFARPQSMAIDTARDELLVTDACNHRIGRFSLDGELRGWIGSPDAPADAPVRFDFPYGLQLLADSTLLVTEFGASHAQRIDAAAGTSLGTFGAPGRGQGRLASPWAATVIGEETFLLDSGNNRILVSRLSGVQGGRG